MMKMIGKVGRKFRTAYMKSSRPKTGRPKPMSDAWRARNAAGDPSAKKELKRHFFEAEQANFGSARRRAADFDAGYPKSPSAKKKPARLTYKGQDMQERNFMKSNKMVGGIRYGTFVSKKAYRTGGQKAVTDAYGSKGFKNYKTRTYQP